jgi:hypothetical protein
MILSSSKNPNNRLKAKKNVVYSCYLHSSSHLRAICFFARAKDGRNFGGKTSIGGDLSEAVVDPPTSWLYDGICYIYVIIFSENC